MEWTGRILFMDAFFANKEINIILTGLEILALMYLRKLKNCKACENMNK